MPTLITVARAALAPLALVTALGAGAQTSAPQQPAGTGPSAAPAAGSRATIDAAFKQADTDADGKLSNAELAQIPALAAKFAELDKNKDGSISNDEFSAGVVVKGQ